jgi:hypothetical protein
MSRQESLEPDWDSNDAGRQPVNGFGGPNSPSPGPSYGSSYGAVSQQYHFVDPGVMALKNTAATIAAVAASALQHITQSKSTPLAANAASASVNSALVAALGGRKPLLPSHQSHGVAGCGAGVPPHLAAAYTGGAPVSFPKHAASSIHAGIHQALIPADTSSHLHHSASAAAHAPASSISNALLPNMQSWSFEQLGENEPVVYLQVL